MTQATITLCAIVARQNRAYPIVYRALRDHGLTIMLRVVAYVSTIRARDTDRKSNCPITII